jgi:CHAT domain-containing protein
MESNNAFARVPSRRVCHSVAAMSTGLRLTGRRVALMSAGAGLVLAASIVIAWLRTGPTRVEAPVLSTDLAALIDAVGPQRLTEGRLTGGFKFGPRPAMSRSASQSDRIDYAVVAHAAQILTRTTDDGRAGVLHAQGVARLLLKEDDRAVSALEGAAIAEPHRADYQSDLAVAYMTRSARSDQPLDLARALEAVEQSLAAQPDGREARYNRALVLARLGLDHAADAARQDYLARDANSPWAGELRAIGAAANGHPAPCAPDAVAGPPRDARAATHDATEERIPECLQVVREQLEWREIPAWADIVHTDRDRARAALARAARLADVIARRSGDQLPLAGTRILATAVSSPRIARLALGHQALESGRQLYEGDRREEAVEPLTRASIVLRREHSPYWLWAELYLARIDSHHRHVTEALARLDVIRAQGRRHGYTSLLARESWLRGLVLFQSSEPARALDSYRTAAAYYDALHEPDNVANVASTMADTQRIMGDLEAGWGALSNALQLLALVRDPTRRYLICYNASLYCRRWGLDRAALVFQDEAVRYARSRQGAGGLVEALLNRSRIHYRLAEPAQGHGDLDAALSLLPRLSDPQQRRYMLARQQAVEAEGVMTSQPLEVMASARRALEYFEGLEPGEVPLLHGLCARAARQLGDLDEAGRELHLAIDAFEQRRLTLEDADARANYFDEGWTLYAELVDLRLAQGRWREAFETAEQSKALSLVDRLPSAASLPASAAALSVLLPARVTLVAFAQHGDRLAWWCLGQGTVTHGDAALPVAEIARLVARLRGTLEGDTPDAEVRLNDLLERLYTALVAPMQLDGARALVWVPDGLIEGVPIAALRNPRTGRYLVEDLDISVAPSARVFFAASRRLTRWDDPRALIVGDPSFNREFFPHVPPLAGARREAAEVSHLYAHAVTLLGSQATRRRVLDLLTRVDIVHLAGHAIGNERVPQMSQLLLAPEPGVDNVGALYEYELARVPLAARVVMLAACKTASGRARPGEGATSFARALLGDGVGAVVGTLWDVDDDAARALSVRFHTHLQRTKDPARALGDAQRELLHHHGVLSWAGFVAYGGMGISLAPKGGNSE